MTDPVPCPAGPRPNPARPMAVILLSWHQARDAAARARQLSRWRRCPLAVHLVDNASTDGNRPVLDALAEGHPGITIHRNPQNRGYAGGVNTALQTILADHPPASVLLLNLDAQIGEEALLRLRRIQRADPRVAAAGPALTETDLGGAAADPVCFGGRDPARHRNTRILRPPPPVPEPCEVDYVPGTVCLLNTHALRTVGLLDERYFFSGEIADWCRRAQQAGFRCVVAPAIRATHHPDAPAQRRNTLYRYYTLRNRFLYVRKHAGCAQQIRWIVTGTLMWCRARSRNRAEARAVAWALRDGLAGRFGNRNDRFEALPAATGTLQPMEAE